MRCLSPVTIKNKAYGKKPNQPITVTVPCGRCLRCVRNRQRAWSVRIAEEMRNSCNTYFLTLTYANAPATGLNLRDVQLFFKKVRRFLQTMGLDRAYPIKHFTVGEYGGKTHRPHYHALVFNFPVDFVDNLIQLWSHGYVDCVVDPTVETVPYITKYMYGSSIDYDSIVGTDEPSLSSVTESLCGVAQNEPFAVMSQGIGRSYIARMSAWHQSDWENRNYYPMKGKNGVFAVSLPRYYRINIFTKVQQQIFKERYESATFSVPYKPAEERIAQQLALTAEASKLKRLKASRKNNSKF